MVMFWISLLAISILLYVLLDGVDLGVGLLFGLANGEARRGAMLSAVAPIWDGNETWLVVTGGYSLGSLTRWVYATLLSAFYLPLIVMLLGLILRGVAFEFRYKTQRLRWIWDVSFAGGSLISTFIQGMTVGALVEGLQFTKGEYSGGEVGWLTPFAGPLRHRPVPRLRASWRLLAAQKMRGRGSRRRARPDPDARGRRTGVPRGCFRLRVGREIFQSCIVGSIGRICSHSRRLERVAAIVLALSILNHNDYWPFYMVALIFMSAFGTLALSFWPYMIPSIITVDQAAAPYSSLAFMFWGCGVVVFPLMLIYTIVSYFVFRGKVRTTAGSH